MTELASEKYQVRLRVQPWWKRTAAWAMMVFQASSGEGTSPAWRFRADIVDAETGRVVGKVQNPLGGQVDDVSAVSADLAVLTSESFELLWLPSLPASSEAPRP